MGLGTSNAEEADAGTGAGAETDAGAVFEAGHFDTIGLTDLHGVPIGADSAAEDLAVRLR